MYADLPTDVARCRDGQNTSKVCVLRPANVDQAVTLLWNTLHCSWTFPLVGFSKQLPVASETQPTILTSLLVFVGNNFTPLVSQNLMLQDLSVTSPTRKDLITLVKSYVNCPGGGMQRGRTGTINK